VPPAARRNPEDAAKILRSGGWANATLSWRACYEGSMEPRVARCVLLAHVLSADGIMATEEKALLAQAMESFKLTDAERQRVHALEEIDPALEVLGALPEAERQKVVDALVSAALADGQLSPLETKLIQRITAALDL